MMVPGYALSWGITWKTLSTARLDKGAALYQMLRKVGLLVAIALVLVPTPLLEPRYFVLPIMMTQLHSSGEQTLTMLHLQATLFIVVNMLTLYVFVERPFMWPGGEVARFMW